MAKKQMLTTNLSSIDKSAGEQGPPNRIAPQSEFPSTPPLQIKSEPITNESHRIDTTSSTTTNEMTLVKTEQISPKRNFDQERRE